MAEQLTVSSENPEMSAVEEAHNQEMLEKVGEVEHGIDGIQPTEQPDDKFGGDYEKLKKSYEELERKFHAPEVEFEKEESDLSIPEQGETPFDMEALTQEYAETGGLTDASYKTLADAGISRDYADTYIAGVKALGEQIGNQVMSSVGGQDEYSTMVEWAKTNYSEQQIEAYDNAVNSGDVNSAMLAAKGLMADYQGSTGKEGTTYGGESPTGDTSGNVFRSNAEVVQAMRDPRYESDMAYRQDVLDKLDRSEIFSTGTI